MPTGPNAILMPGLINTHTHAAMSLLPRHRRRLRLSRTGSNKFIFPAEAKNVTPDFVLWGTRLACLEMMLSGTTTFVDMYYFEDRVAQAAKEAGMRGILGETMIRFKSPDAATPERHAPAHRESFSTNTRTTRSSSQPSPRTPSIRMMTTILKPRARSRINSTHHW